MDTWTCKIGEAPGSFKDLPMREAIARAYEELTGQPPTFVFSGWGGELTEAERAVVEDRLPGPRVWAMPEIPDDVTAVSDREGHVWHRTTADEWHYENDDPGPWGTPLDGLLPPFGPLTEVTDGD